MLGMGPTRRWTSRFGSLVLAVCGVAIFLTVSKPSVPGVDPAIISKGEVGQLGGIVNGTKSSGHHSQGINNELDVNGVSGGAESERSHHNITRPATFVPLKTLETAKEKALVARQEGKTMLFHHYENGNSGAVVQDMLFCHAYAFHNNAVYGGSCGERTGKHELHEALLTSIGLQKELIFSCPRDHHGDLETKRQVISKDLFRQKGTRLMTPAYIDFLKARVKYPARQSDRYTIAVHIRRLDVTPCKEDFRGFSRYLPNLHYQTLIDLHMKPDARVIIFSQSSDFESLDSFREKGYEIYEDKKVTDVWSTLVVSDVLIMSRSSFSLIPAVVAKGLVVYTPFWHKALKGWEVIGPSIISKTDEELARLRLSC